MKKKLVFLGSKPIGYECLLYLIAQKDGLNIEIAGVLTQVRKEFGNANDLTQLSIVHKIPLISSIDEIPDCDIIYSVQYHQILKQQHINKAKDIAVNLHMAPLPEYRGSNQFSYAIIDRKKEFGTTIHQIDTKIDHGAVLFQDRFPIHENCWIYELYDLTYHASLKLFKDSISNIIAGDYTLTPQEKLLDSHTTSLHFRSEIAELKKIDLNWDEEKILRYIRATSMPGFEPPYCVVSGKKMYFSTEYK